MGILAVPAMGNGHGILWIWMTMSISVVYLSPLFLDPDKPSGMSPNYLHMKKLISNDFLVPDQTLGLFSKNKEKYVKNSPFGTMQPFNRLRRAGKCLFNSLAYNCDFQDAIGAAQEASYWGSGSPGRRKRSLYNLFLHCLPSYDSSNTGSETNKYWMRVGRKH